MATSDNWEETKGQYLLHIYKFQNFQIFFADNLRITELDEVFR